MSKPFDKILLDEMKEEDNYKLLSKLEEDGSVIDRLMETESIQEALNDVFPPEEKFMEV